MCLGLNVGMCIIMVICNVFVCNGILICSAGVEECGGIEILKTKSCQGRQKEKGK